MNKMITAAFTLILLLNTGLIEKDNDTTEESQAATTYSIMSDGDPPM